MGVTNMSRKVFSCVWHMFCGFGYVSIEFYKTGCRKFPWRQNLSISIAEQVVQEMLGFNLLPTRFESWDTFLPTDLHSGFSSYSYALLKLRILWPCPNDFQLVPRPKSLKVSFNINDMFNFCSYSFKMRPIICYLLGLKAMLVVFLKHDPEVYFIFFNNCKSLVLMRNSI